MKIGWKIMLICIGLLVVGCQPKQKFNQSARFIAPVTIKRNFNPSDWGPAYQPGMEYGPAEKQTEIAMGIAEIYLAQQPYANRYAKRACSAGGCGKSQDIYHVEFALLSDSTGKEKGCIEVNMKTRTCIWVEKKQ